MMLLEAKRQAERDIAQTLEYYDRHAESYFETTRGIDMSSLYERFTRKLPKGARILDAGSGSGRDTLAFLRRGYSVDAFDASPVLCELSTRLTRVRTRILCFQELEDTEEFDGIWACASLLHVPETEMSDSIGRLVRSLKPGGVLFMSFKYGAGERVNGDSRFFTDMTETRLHSFLQALPNAKLEEVWITSGEGQFQGQNKWLNALVSKSKNSTKHG